MKTFKYHPYTIQDIEKIVLFKGFICPKGNFYNVWEYNGERPKKYKEISHSLFAEKYYEEQLGITLKSLIQRLPTRK